MRRKSIFIVVMISLLSIGAYYVWYVHFNYRFEEISKNKVYKSALIPADKLDSFLVKNNIKTVIDLLDPGVQDALNPAKKLDIDNEAEAIANINKKYALDIQHINIASPQVPTKKTLSAFYEVLDDERNYPVLIHCYHGMGRAPLYSALYRVEYENWKNKDAREKTRVIVEGFGYRSSFADAKPKGDFLMHYKPRKDGINSTLNQLRE